MTKKKVGHKVQTNLRLEDFKEKRMQLYSIESKDRAKYLLGFDNAGQPRFSFKILYTKEYAHTVIKKYPELVLCKAFNEIVSVEEQLLHELFNPTSLSKKKEKKQ